MREQNKRIKIFDDELIRVMRLWIISFHFVQRSTSLSLASLLLL